MYVCTSFGTTEVFCGGNCSIPGKIFQSIIVHLGWSHQQFKRAKVTPILKDAKGDSKAPANYRGISLAPILSKILERIVIA